MAKSHNIPVPIMAALRASLGEQMDQYIFPPPVFVAMQGELLDYVPENHTLSARFPVLENWLNPYGIMQGGMLSAAIDNTIGPLSVLLAPPNVTRNMELKYKRSATQEMGFIYTTAHLLERDDRWLKFKAEALDPQGKRLVQAKAAHWIL
jgi:acyl-coenzyme A thioesterase PaaI-like protein